MRAFLASCLAILIIAIGAFVILNVAQRTATAAYSTDSVRVNPRWSTRRVFKRPAPVPGQAVPVGQLGEHGVDSGECEVASAYAWLVVDFSGAVDDNPGCR
jgi:hypothetical protein